MRIFWNDRRMYNHKRGQFPAGGLIYEITRRLELHEP